MLLQRTQAFRGLVDRDAASLPDRVADTACQGFAAMVGGRRRLHDRRGRGTALGTVSRCAFAAGAGITRRLAAVRGRGLSGRADVPQVTYRRVASAGMVTCFRRRAAVDGRGGGS